MIKKNCVKAMSCVIATLLMSSNFINCSAQSKVEHDIKKKNSHVGLKVAASGVGLAGLAGLAVLFKVLYNRFHDVHKFKYMPKNDTERCFGALWYFIFTTGLDKKYFQHVDEHTGNSSDGKEKICPGYCLWEKRPWYGENTKLHDAAVRFFERFDRPDSSITKEDISAILGSFKLEDLEQIFGCAVFNNTTEMAGLGLKALHTDESAQNRQTFEYFYNYGFNEYMLWQNERGSFKQLCYGKNGIFEKFQNDNDYQFYYEDLWGTLHPNVPRDDNPIYVIWYVSCNHNECNLDRNNLCSCHMGFSYQTLDEAIQFMNSHTYVPSKEKTEQPVDVLITEYDSTVYEELDNDSIADIHTCNLAASLFESCKNINDERLNGFRALVDDCKSDGDATKLDLTKLKNKFKVNSQTTKDLKDQIVLVKNVLAALCQGLQREARGPMRDFLVPWIFRENMRMAWENKFQVSLLDKFFSSDFEIPLWREGEVPSDCSEVLLAANPKVSQRSTPLENYVKPIMERLPGYREIENQNQHWGYEGRLMVDYLFGSSRYSYRLPALASENVNRLIYHIATWLDKNMNSKDLVIKEAIESFKFAFVATNGNCANELLCLLHQWMIIIDDAERRLGRYKCDDISDFINQVLSAVRSNASENMIVHGKLMEKTQEGSMGQENRNTLRKEHALGLNVPFIVWRGGGKYNDIGWNERRNAFVSCVSLAELFGRGCDYFKNASNKNDLIDICKEIKLTYGQSCEIFDNSNIQNGARLPEWDSVKEAYDNIFSKKFSERFPVFLNSLDADNHNVQNLQKWFDGKIALNPEDLANIIQNIQNVDTKNVPEINKYNARYNDDAQAQYFGHVLFPIYLFHNGYLAIPQ